jgi:hypothetical protein
MSMRIALYIGWHRSAKGERLELEVMKLEPIKAVSYGRPTFFLAADSSLGNQVSLIIVKKNESPCGIDKERKGSAQGREASWRRRSNE